MKVEVRLARPADLDEVYALRHEVFVLGQDVPAELERDELDAGADHAVARLDGRVVGTGRLVDGRTDEQGRLLPDTAGTVGTIGRMAVAEDARGAGTGRVLLDLLVARAAERGLPAVELHAQVHARGFYERAGFTPYGEVYLEAGIEHLGMRRQLRRGSPGRRRGRSAPVSGDVAQQLAERMQAEQWTFATAESVTAGLVADRAAQGKGASEWLLGGVVAYATGTKQRLLGVVPGPVVNPETAGQMARGVAELMDADVTVATTGVGGPDPEEGQPAGTVWVGVNVAGQVTTHRLQLSGDPEDICTGAAEAALRLVLEALPAR